MALIVAGDGVCTGSGLESRSGEGCSVEMGRERERERIFLKKIDFKLGEGEICFKKKLKIKSFRETKCYFRDTVLKKRILEKDRKKLKPF